MNDVAYSYSSNTERINTDGILSAILSEFDTMSIVQVVKDSIDKYLFRPYNCIQAPNMIYAYEQNFQLLLKQFPSYSENVLEVRNTTYYEIICLICSSFNLQFSKANSDDWYHIAYLLYDICVANFTQNIISFFVRMIDMNRPSLSNYVKLELDDERKKSKNNSMINYAKHFFTDDQLVLIYSNLEQALDTICCFDINLEQYLSIITIKADVELVINNIYEIQNYFKTIIVPFLSDNSHRVDIISLVRLTMQRELSDKIMRGVVYTNGE